jgi:hypothetical protein
MIINESLHKTIVQNSFESLSLELKHWLKKLESEAEQVLNQKTSEPIMLFERLQFPEYHCGTGIYFITYAPNAKFDFNLYQLDLGKDAEIMYVGQGNISQRKAIHTQIFRNKGNPKVYYKNNKISSQSDSVVARKMYQHDPAIRNWRFSYILAEKSWAPTLENYYIQELNPVFNDEKMSGVS